MCRKTGEFVEAIHSKMHANMALVLENTRDQELKLSALNRLVATSLHGLSN